MAVPVNETAAPANPWAVDPGDFPGGQSLRHQLLFLLNYAILAPSGHNSQPWLFRLGDDTVEVRADRSRRLPVVDPQDRELTISCGAAAETLALAARQFGLSATLTPLPDPDDPDLIATVGISPDPEAPKSVAVLEAIKRRRTTRKSFDPEPLPPRLRVACTKTTEVFGVSAIFTGDSGTHAAIARLVDEGDRRQFDDPAFRRELADWIRPRSAPGRDGMSADAFGMPDVLSGVGAFVIRTFDVGGLAASGDVRKIEDGSPVFLALASAADTPADWVATGRALTDVLVALAGEGWTASYLNQPIELPDLRQRLGEALHINRSPQLLLRIGRCDDLPDPAARRPVEDVLLQ